MKYWLVKSEPDVYSYQNLVAEQKTLWTGVRNYQARNNLSAMKCGDRVLFYHSNGKPPSGKTVVGIAEVIEEAMQEPGAEAGWVAVMLAPVAALAKPVSLDSFKNDKILKNTALVRLPRLSVQPVTQEEYQRVLELGSKE
jgi:predicted RNA-binding protein with PUA-like domain